MTTRNAIWSRANDVALTTVVELELEHTTFTGLITLRCSIRFLIKKNCY